MATKKPAAKKSPARKTAAKKTAAAPRKTAVKRAAAPAAKAPARKTAAKKTAAKKTAAPKRGAASRASFGASYLERFRRMVEELRADPEIHVHQHQINAPASAEDLAAVEAHLGAPLAPEIRSFYEAADGLTLRWIHARHPEIESPMAGRGEPTLDTDAVLGGSTIEHGIINLLPARRTFIDEDWNGGIWFDHMADDEPIEIDGEVVPSLELHKALRPFDVYNFYEFSALYCKPGNGDPPVLYGTDHGVDFGDSFEEKTHDTFADYLETILAQRGLVGSRGNVRSRDYWEAHPISTKKLLAGLELTPRKSNGGDELVARLKKKNKDALRTVSDEEIARVGADRAEVVAVLRKQLAPDDWLVLRALQRLRAFEESDVPLLVRVAKKGGDAAMDALGDLAATSDRALSALVGMLGDRRPKPGDAPLGARAIAVLPRAGERSAAAVPHVVEVLDGWLAGPRPLSDPGTTDLRPWLLFLVLSGPRGATAVPQVSAIQQEAGKWREELDGSSSSWPSYRVTVDRFAIAAILAVRDAPSEVRIDYVKRYLPPTSTYGSTTLFEEITILEALWPRLGAHAPEALPVLESYLRYMRGLASTRFGAEAVINTRRLVRLAETLPRDVIRPWLAGLLDGSSSWFKPTHGPGGEMAAALLAARARAVDPPS